MKVKQFVFNMFQENTYLIWDETGEAAIIDAGMLFDREKSEIKTFIEEEGLKPVLLLNTHLHLDHQFGNKFIHDTYGLEPLAGEEDEFLLEKIHAGAAAYGIPYTEPIQYPGSHIADNQEIKFGNTVLKALHTPGHSPGSFSFYNEKAGVVFSGDALFSGSIGRTDFEKGDYATLIGAIQNRLLPLPDETVVYSGHGPSTTIGEERESNPYL